MMRRRPLWVAAACGVLLGLGGIVAFDAATETADAQGELTVSAAQLQINQRISQAAVRRSNEALGLLGPVRPAESTDKNPVNPFASVERGSGWPTFALADGAVTSSKLSPELRAQVEAPGPEGPQGAPGPPGPSTGPAGGDLTGSYPDPQVAPVPAASLDESATQTAASATDVVLRWDETDSPLTYDPLDMHTEDQPDRLTAPRDGLYYVSAGAAFFENAPTGGVGLRTTALILQPARYDVPIERAVPQVGGITIMSGGAHVPMRAGESVQVLVGQTSGGPLQVNPVHFSMAYVSALA